MSWIDNFRLWGEPVKKTRPQSISNNRRNIMKNLRVERTDTRPSETPDLMNKYAHTSLGGLNQYVTTNDLKAIAYYSDILYMTLNKLKFEIFRKGYDIEAIKEDPIEEQKERAESFMQKCNENGQSLKEVCEEIEDDLNIFDDAYGLLLKKYGFNGSNIIEGLVNEFIRINPISVEIMADDLSRIGRNKEGVPIYVSIHDRSSITTEPYNLKTGEQNLRACYRVIGSKRDLYYDSTEIIHVSKYKPSKLYGFSPLYSLYNKTMTLINQDKYMKDYYSGDKVPKGILVANTSNTESFKANLKEWKAQTRRDPHGVHPILHSKGNGDTQPVFEFINLMNNLNEMQYTQTRDEIRRNVGALFGVSSVFMNDTSTSGGLNNEGLQITVTNRAAEHGQSIYNNKIFPFVFDQMGITDWKISLIPTEEQDEASDKDLRLKEIQIAKQTAELGIKVRMNEQGDFIYTAGEVELQNTQDEFIPFQNNKGNVEVTTPVKLSKKESPEQDLETALDKELKKIIEQLDRKRKPSEEEFKKIVDKISSKFDTQLKKKSSTRLKAIYEKAMKEVGKEVNTKFSLTEKDKNVLEALKRDVVYQKAFSNISDNVSTRLKEVITGFYETPEKFTINNIVDSMKEELEKTDNELRRIARTETSKISIAARKVSYEKTGAKYKYKWIGPNDNRTADVSKIIKKRTQSGVSWDELVKVIEEESRKQNPKWEVNPLAPIPFPNTRHTFIAERID